MRRQSHSTQRSEFYAAQRALSKRIDSRQQSELTGDELYRWCSAGAALCGEGALLLPHETLVCHPPIEAPEVGSLTFRGDSIWLGRSMPGVGADNSGSVGGQARLADDAARVSFDQDIAARLSSSVYSDEFTLDVSDQVNDEAQTSLHGRNGSHRPAIPDKNPLRELARLRLVDGGEGPVRRVCAPRTSVVREQADSQQGEPRCKSKGSQGRGSMSLNTLASALDDVVLVTTEMEDREKAIERPLPGDDLLPARGRSRSSTSTSSVSSSTDSDESSAGPSSQVDERNRLEDVEFDTLKPRERAARRPKVIADEKTFFRGYNQWWEKCSQEKEDERSKLVATFEEFKWPARLDAPDGSVGSSLEEPISPCASPISEAVGESHEAKANGKDPPPGSAAPSMKPESQSSSLADDSSKVVPDRIPDPHAGIARFDWAYRLRVDDVPSERPKVARPLPTPPPCPIPAIPLSLGPRSRFASFWSRRIAESRKTTGAASYEKWSPCQLRAQAREGGEVAPDVKPVTRMQVELWRTSGSGGQQSFVSVQRAKKSG